MKRALPRIVIAAMAAACLGWWALGRSKPAAPMSFRTVAVSRGDITQSVSGSGTLSAITTVEVGTQVSGKIIKLHVDYNDQVKKEQLIAEIDPTSYQARLVQAEADLLSARATLELRQLNAQRSGELLAKKLISQSDFDTVTAELRQQEAVARKAEGAVNSTRLDVEHCKITSPIAGVVLERSVDAGQTVQSSMTAPTLYKLAQDLRQMQITANISEADIGGVESGQPVVFTVDAFPSRTFKGTVREVRNNSTTSNNVVTYPTIITVDNADMKLRPGMTANVTITTARRSGVLRVANAALRYRPPEGAIVRAGTPGENSSRNPPPAAGDVQGSPAPEPNFEDVPADMQQRLLVDIDKDGDGKLSDQERTTMRAAIRLGPPPGAPGESDRPPAPSSPTVGERTSSDTASTRTVYLLSTEGGTAELVATSVTTGLSDGAHTEIISGLAEGNRVITGTLAANQSAGATASNSSTATTNPFAPPRPPAGGPPPR